MRRALLAGAAALAAIAVPAAAKPAESPPDRVLVRGSEFNLTLSKTKVTPGRVIVQFLNDGEDPHDLRIARVGGDGAEFGFGEVGPGEYQNLDARLRKRSTYVLWCSLSDHRELGMEATLRTKRHRPR
jgi:plastocyanin